MIFKNNGTKFYLLTNKPILFWNEENNQRFEIITPTLEDIYTDDNLLFLITMFEKDLEELQKFIDIKITSFYNFIHIVFTLSKKIPEFMQLKEKLLKGLKKIVPTIRFDSIFWVGEKTILSKEIFEDIIDIIFLSLDKKVIKINDDDDEFTKMEKNAALRAEKIRNNSKDKKEGVKIDDIVSAILYEFQQYKIEDLMKMNLYTIYFLFKSVGKIANYEVSKIASGNGLAKKHKYFIEK